MATFVHDCPKCKAKGHTFDLKHLHLLHLDEKSVYHQDIDAIFQTYAICRKCKYGTAFGIFARNNYARHLCEIQKNIESVPIDLTDECEWIRPASFADIEAQKAPDHVPSDIEKAFNEAATCFAVQCYNAAGAMLRRCLELSIKSLMPEEVNRPNLHQRLEYLFKENIISTRLQELSHCIKEDGNCASHGDNDTSEEIAKDMLEFTNLLLQDIFTYSQKIKNAKERQDQKKQLNNV